MKVKHTFRGQTVQRVATSAVHDDKHRIAICSCVHAACHVIRARNRHMHSGMKRLLSRTRRDELGLLAKGERRPALRADEAARTRAQVVFLGEGGVIAGLSAPLLLEGYCSFLLHRDGLEAEFDRTGAPLKAITDRPWPSRRARNWLNATTNDTLAMYGSSPCAREPEGTRARNAYIEAAACAASAAACDTA